jgi:hypothetical protein
VNRFKSKNIKGHLHFLSVFRSSFINSLTHSFIHSFIPLHSLDHHMAKRPTDTKTVNDIKQVTIIHCPIQITLSKALIIHIIYMQIHTARKYKQKHSNET